MEDGFDLLVHFNGRELSFPTTMRDYGYTLKLEVDVHDTKVVFEPDEERNWRALISFEDLQANKQLDADLLKAIVKVIEAITK